MTTPVNPLLGPSQQQRCADCKKTIERDPIVLKCGHIFDQLCYQKARATKPDQECLACVEKVDLEAQVLKNDTGLSGMQAACALCASITLLISSIIWFAPKD